LPPWCSEARYTPAARDLKFQRSSVVERSAVNRDREHSPTFSHLRQSGPTEDFAGNRVHPTRSDAFPISAASIRIEYQCKPILNRALLLLPTCGVFAREVSNLTHQDATREYFDAVADRWDEMRRTFFGEGVRQAVIRAANISSSSVVADVGTGTGFLAEAALAAGARVIGIDASEGMLDQARSRFPSDRFEARAGDMEALPLGGSEVDAVLANMVLHHAKHPPLAIREMARVLKPGGMLVVTDADKHHEEWLRTEQHDRWLGFRRADIESWFKGSGFVDVGVGDTDEFCCPTAECGKKAEITIFLARGRKPM
jgi:ubiquinone/menaquinone biosynthesis C-methylase UbiE